MASAYFNDNASMTSHISRVGSVKVNTPFKSTRSEYSSASVRKQTKRFPVPVPDTRYYPCTPPDLSNREKAAPASPSSPTTTVPSNVKPDKMILRSYYKKVLLILLVILGSSGAIGYSVRANRKFLQQLSVMSALHYLGVVADPALQAKIGDLSKQIEDLQRMVTMLIPQQQQRIELLQQKQIEQQKTQLEQEKRDAERQEAEKRRKEEEARRLEEEKKREEERQRTLELEKIKQLELQKKQLELELKLKQEEERRKHWREEARRREEEKLVREAEEEQKILAAEEEEEKEKAALVQEQTGKHTDSVQTCSAELNGVCEAETLSSVIKDLDHDNLAIAKEEWEKLVRGLEEEKAKLKEEIEKWEEFKEREIIATQKRSEEAYQLLTEAGEKEQKATDEYQHELVKTLSKELFAKLEELEQENSALRARIEQMESDLSAKIDSLVTEIDAVKKQVKEEPDNETDTGATNVQEVQDLINKSIKLYHADEVGMPDYALESSGAVVFTIGETVPYTRDTPWMGVFGISIWRSCKTPRLAIQKDNSPGNCWSFTGDKGAITVQLSAQVFPEYFTMDHIPLELAPNGNASSAPYHFRILGLDYGNAPKGHVLGNYEFTEFPIQTFAVQQNPYEKYFRFIKLEILSNHGNKDYTCLYRFRVHGTPHDTDTYNG